MCETILAWVGPLLSILKSLSKWLRKLLKPKARKRSSKKGRRRRSGSVEIRVRWKMRSDLR